MAMEIEDDVFFADLNKQIAQLIMDDDDDEVELPVQSAPFHFQGFQHMPQRIIPQPYIYEMPYRNESKGTGVFIPRASSIPKRRNRNTGKSSSHSNQQQVDRAGAKNYRVADNDRLPSGYYRNSSFLQNNK